MNRAARLLSAMLAALLLLPVLAAAEEASQARATLEPFVEGARGRYRWSFSQAAATLDVRLRRLQPDREYRLMINAFPVTSFTTNARGSAEVSVDLSETGAGIAVTNDPRDLGLWIAETELGQPVMNGVTIDDPANDRPHARWTEVTSLAPVGGALGEASATYTWLGKGAQRVTLRLKGVAAGDYEIFVDSTLIGVVTSDRAGSGRVELSTRTRRTSGGAGSRHPHRLNAPLVGRARHASIEVRRANALEFTGAMHARIPGLDVCAPASALAPLVLDVAAPSGAGTIEISRAANCDVHVSLAVQDLPSNQYYVQFPPASGWTFPVPGAGSGLGSATLEMDEQEGPNGFFLPIGTRSGSAVEVGVYPSDGSAPVLTGTIP